MKKALFLLLSFLFFEFVFGEYKKIDGSKLISISYTPNAEYDASEIVSPENLSQEMLAYYSWFASYGYCQDVDIPVLCCKNYYDFFNKKWTIVDETSTTKYYNYNFILWRNDEYKKYILGFPGTRSDQELIDEGAHMNLVNYDGVDNGIKVVAYWYNVVVEIRNLIFSSKNLKDIEAHPGYQFILTGHSLGGSVASIAIYDAVTKNYINKNNNPALISFGQPRSGNEKWVLDFNTKIKNVIRVVRDGDMIPTIPYSAFSNPYRHLGGLVLLNKNMNALTYCPKDIGEDYPDKECQSSKSTDMQYHKHYFNPDTELGLRCA